MLNINSQIEFNKLLEIRIKSRQYSGIESITSRIENLQKIKDLNEELAEIKITKEQLFNKLLFYMPSSKVNLLKEML